MSHAVEGAETTIQQYVQSAIAESSEEQNKRMTDVSFTSGKLNLIFS
jgi:hypothetical protein